MNDENIWRSKISLNCPFNLSYVLVVFVALVGAWFMMVNVVVIVIVVNVVEAVVTGHWSPQRNGSIICCEIFCAN